MDHSHGVFSRFRMTIGAVFLMPISLMVLFLLSTARVPTVQAWPEAPATRPPGPAFVKPGGTGTLCLQAAPCGSIQYAIEQSVPGNGDTIYVAEGTYTGTGAAVITITKSITLYGGWDGSPVGEISRDPQSFTTRIDGEDLRRGVFISGTIAPTLDGLLVINGNASGLGGYTTYDAGGGIYVNKAAALISHCTIISNTAKGGLGGGIIFVHSNARLESNLIANNTASWGGGVRVIAGNPVIWNNHFLGNTASYGGGLYLMWSQSTVADNAFQANEASDGGGLYLSGDGSTISGNLIEENRGSYGAGIGINTGGQPAVISRNVILNNRAEFRGGGIIIRYNNARLYNNVIAHNETNSEGAGVYVRNASPQFGHNTLAQNTGGEGSAIYLGTSASVVLTNTILVSHTVGITVTAGSAATLEATLWGSEAWANGTNWGGDGTIVTSPGDIWGNPAFVNPAAGDYHLGPGSEAINAGVDAGVTTDIDGDPRPFGAAPDIGADEFVAKTYLPLVLRSYP